MKRIFGIFVAIFAVAVASAYGLSSTPVSAAGSASLSIAPVKRYEVTPGETINDTLRIQNTDKSKPLSLQIQVIDFTYTDDTGTPKLLLDQSIPQTPWSLKPYLKVPETVSIQPGETKTVDVSLLMPKKQGPGSYYSAIIYSTGASQGGNVGLSASGATLVFASVPGKVNENLQLEKFGAYIPNKGNNGFVKFTMEKPTRLAYTAKNSGNVTESPVGRITYKYMFGKEQQINDINPNGSMALIGQSRTFISCIKLKQADEKTDGGTSRIKECDNPTLWPGLYKVHLDVIYGQNGNINHEMIGNSYFWYLPWWFLVPFLIIVALLVIGIWRVVVKVRAKLYGPKTSAKRRK